MELPYTEIFIMGTQYEYPISSELNNLSLTQTLMPLNDSDQTKN